MKNWIYYLMTFIGMAFISCEPMEEIHEQVDATLAMEAVEGITEYTLTDEDYAALDLSFGNFSSLDDARALIPSFLSKKFPVWGDGSLALVTFDLYDPVRVEPYTLTSEDYGIVGAQNDYLSSISQVTDFLEVKYPQAEAGEFVELTYRTVAVKEAYEITDADFEILGDALATKYPEPAASAAQYGNFDRRPADPAYWSNEMILEAINVVLSERFTGIEGQTYGVSYDIYDGSSGTESQSVRFNGNTYELYGSAPYEFTDTDYQTVESAMAAEHPGPAANAAQYGSFDISPDSPNYWSPAMILEAINIVLKDQYPSAAVGAQYAVTYVIYDGSTSPVTESVVLDSSGQYIIDETAVVSVVTKSSVFANDGENWRSPYLIPENLYVDEFEQSYSNFDNDEDVAHYVSIHLNSAFPYAQEGDLIPVGYLMYDDGETSLEYSNFVYTNGQFEYIPSVIPATLQFGHDGTNWVPDNTIPYTLAQDDYVYIGEQLAEKYPDPAWSVGNYSNFDRRPGNINQWTDAMVLEAMNILLKDKVAPSAEEGQKYLLTFDIYNGTNTTEQFHLVKSGAAWVPVE